MRLLTASSADITRFHAVVGAAGGGVVAVASDLLVELLIVLHHRRLIMAVVVRIVLTQLKELRRSVANEGLRWAEGGVVNLEISNSAVQLADAVSAAR